MKKSAGFSVCSRNSLWSEYSHISPIFSILCCQYVFYFHYFIYCGICIHFGGREGKMERSGVCTACDREFSNHSVLFHHVNYLAGNAIGHFV